MTPGVIRSGFSATKLLERHSKMSYVKRARFHGGSGHPLVKTPALPRAA
jgi:hypothetical protein